MSREGLGNFELLVLLALIRLGDAAYGVPIAEMLTKSLGRDVAAASVYAALARLAQKDLVTSRMGESTPERGGRARRYFRITAAGIREVRAARSALTKLWNRIPVLKGQPA
jgi:PadR family transcriptional regulator, regulatory protein PadR